MIRKRIELEDIHRMTSRSAAMIVQASCKYKSRILIEQRTKVINAKSLMGVLSLSVGSGDSLYLVLDGEDEDAAQAEIESLIIERFSETA